MLVRDGMPDLWQKAGHIQPQIAANRPVWKSVLTPFDTTWHTYIIDPWLHFASVHKA